MKPLELLHDASLAFVGRDTARLDAAAIGGNRSLLTHRQRPPRLRNPLMIT
jgi:hypothetical protein